MNPAIAAMYLNGKLLQIKTIETDLFAAIEEYRRNPSLELKIKVKTLQDIYCRFTL